MNSRVPPLKLIDHQHHRNGVGGEGFYVTTFRAETIGLMVAIRFDSDPMRTAILDVRLLAEGNITFGENSWRGDEYSIALQEIAPIDYDESYGTCPDCGAVLRGDGDHLPGFCPQFLSPEVAGG